MGELTGSDPVTDNYLAHYGVVGMKWGKRKGGIKGALQDSVERRYTSNKEIAEGRGQARDYRRRTIHRLPGALTAGSTKSAARRAKKLGGQLDRMKSGKATARDILGAAANTQLLDLVVSRRDKRAIPGAQVNKVNSGKAKAGQVLLGIGTAALILNANNIVRAAAK